MQVIIAFIFAVVVVVLFAVAVVSYFNSGAGKKKKELRAERVRSNLAQNALREISAGAEMPVFLASNALAEINKTYTKEIE